MVVWYCFNLFNINCSGFSLVTLQFLMVGSSILKFLQKILQVLLCLLYLLISLSKSSQWFFIELHFLNFSEFFLCDIEWVFPSCNCIVINRSVKSSWTIHISRASSKLSWWYSDLSLNVLAYFGRHLSVSLRWWSYFLEDFSSSFYFEHWLMDDSVFLEVFDVFSCHILVFFQLS